MKFSFKKKWLQNITLGFVVAVIVSLLFFLREFIKAYTSPDIFFYSILIIVVLVTINILLASAIRLRADAIANSRTADLLETQKLFVELYRNSPVPYVIVDHKGTVTYPNHAALHLFGLESDSFAGRNLFEMFEVVDDEDGMKSALISSSFSRGVFVGNKDVIIKKADGKTRYGLLSVFPYGGSSFHKKGLMTIVDITKQKEIEKTKTEFVSVASHQLRTPVSSMKWNLELLSSPQFGVFTPEQQKYYEKIARGLTRMNNLIDDFLNVSQLELGTKRISYSKVILKDFMEEICEEYAGRIAEKNFTLKKVYDDRVQFIETDKKLLHMVVSNLVSNATKYTNENGTITVQYTAGYDIVTLSVMDNGVGIPAEDQEKLFTKFFRAENVREAVTGGTGLGLYIVKLSVEQLGGKISVKSEEGKGTSFDIVLPYSIHGLSQK